MTKSRAKPWEHDHVFGQNIRRDGEWRTRLVLGMTIVTMIIEIVAGIIYGSMALLADGLHMVGHAAVLGISVFAYVVARKRAHDGRFSFGTGKVNALGGFTSALLLASLAVFMIWESSERLLYPMDITFDQALIVAFLGLVVNGIGAYLLHPPGEHHHDHHSLGLEHHDHSSHHGEDHNLRAAYFHVLADALTSILAIVALLFGKYFGAIWLDSVIGIVGAVVIGFWAVNLLRHSSRVLLDMQAPEKICREIKGALEEDGDAQVQDLHVWEVGTGIYAVEISVCAVNLLSPDGYKARLPAGLRLVHVTIETHKA